MDADPFAPLGDAPEMPSADDAGPDDASFEWHPFPGNKDPSPATFTQSGKLPKPSALYFYRNPESAVLVVVAQYETVDSIGILKKDFRPWCYGRKRWTSKAGNPQDRTGWHCMVPPTPRPLYGLDCLAVRPVAPVLVCEGEKSADAAGLIFPDHVCVTSQGGSKAPAASDWSSLAGRAVTIWPDRDNPGWDYAESVATFAKTAGAASVRVVDVPGDWPDRWDLADQLPDGVSSERLREMLDGATAAAEAKPAAASDCPMPFGYMMRADGVYWRHPDDAGATPTHVCGPLQVAAVTNDGTGHAWGRLLCWPDDDGRQHHWAMPMDMLAGEDTGIRARLLEAGLYVASNKGARERLTAYIQHSKPKDRVRVVARIGWHGSGADRVFVLPGETIGAEGADRVMLQTDRPEAMPPLAQSGTLADWQDKVARLAVGNSRLAFSLAVALAAPLVWLIGAEGGGFHLRGPSSVGKSTALQAAGSVWGGGGLRGWVRSWRTTDNSLEAVAASHNDLLLVLDEMGEAGAETVAASAYMLANGAGKGRAGRDGSARRAAEWRVLFLSSGEVGIADRLAEARGGPIRVKAGQEVRVLDIPAEAGPHGLFETLHGFPSAGGLADAVKAGAASCYGTAGRAWLAYLVADPDGMAAAARDVMAAFLKDRLPVGADGQVGRAAQRFALVAAAGELAAEVGLLPWEPGEAEGAAAACFQAWVAARAGGTGAAEDAAAIAAVRRCIGAYGESRFQNIDASDDRPVLNRLGWRKKDKTGWRYLFLPEAWKNDAVPGLDPEAAARALRAAGYLVPQSESEKRHSRMERVGLAKPVRVYAISESILAGADPEVGEEAGEASP